MNEILHLRFAEGFETESHAIHIGNTNILLRVSTDEDEVIHVEVWK